MKIIVTVDDLLELYKSQFAGKKAIEKYLNWFPVRSSPQLAGVVADLICDGHLQGPPKWRMDYTSKSKEELIRFEKNVFELFGLKGKIRKCKGNKWGTSYNYGVNCKPLARLLSFCGVPTGAKVYKKFSIPLWIQNDKECFREFVKRVFECEGYAWSGKGPGIGLTMNKAKALSEDGRSFFKQIKIGLARFFGIDSTKIFTYKFESNNTVPLKFYIKKKRSVLKFNSEIGFSGGSKKRNLDILVERYK